MGRPRRPRPPTGQRPQPPRGTAPHVTPTPPRPAPRPEQNLPSADRDIPPPRATPSYNPHLDSIDATDTDRARRRADEDRERRMPKKLTVTRVAAMRSRELTQKGVRAFNRAAAADGADRSGLEALTYPTILNFALDAMMSVALANTLFFAAAQGESKSKVALYLLINIAPFAVIAPLIGPLLDRLQRGRRVAMATTFGVRALLALVIISYSFVNADGLIDYQPWALYPCALGMLVMSKSFGVLKSAVTPRVVPPAIDLVRVNSRLTTFGLVFGYGVGGGIAAIFDVGLGRLFELPGALILLVVVALVGVWLCMRIPSWVEVTEGEVPTTLTYHGEPAADGDRPWAYSAVEGEEEHTARGLGIAAAIRQPLGRSVLTGLWGNGTIRIFTGFLTLFVAFYAKAQAHLEPWQQLAIIGGIGAAAGVGTFLGNAAGTRMKLGHTARINVICTAVCTVGAVGAALLGNILVAGIATFVASAASAVGKVCLDASIQNDLPEESRASAFGRSETVLQLTWVLGAALGVLLWHDRGLGLPFAIVSALLVIGLVQTALTLRGATLVPGFGGKRPEVSMPSGIIRRDGQPG